MAKENTVKSPQSQSLPGQPNQKKVKSKNHLSAAEKTERTKHIAFIIWSLVGSILLLAALIYLLQVLAIPVSIIIWTMVIVFCLRGVVNGLQARGINRGVGTTISYVLMFVILAAIAFMMFSPVFGLNTQFANIISSIPEYIDAIREWMDGLYKDYGTWLDNETIKKVMDSAGNSLSGWASSMASGAAGAVVDFGTTVANTFTAIGFAMVIAFWILLELPQLGAEARRVISPKYREDSYFLHLTFTRILGGYIKATLIQCFIIGVAAGILYAVLGVPNAAAMAVITGVMNIIPIIGPWIGGAIAGFSAIFVSPIVALIALIGVIVVQQFVYTFVSPKIMQSSVDIHPALTLFGMMVGSAVGAAMSGMLGSLVGMLFAIPACAVIKSCFIYYFERQTGRQIVADDGFFFKGEPSDDVNPLVDATGQARKEHKNQMNIIVKDVEKNLHHLEDHFHHDKDDKSDPDDSSVKSKQSDSSDTSESSKQSDSDDSSS